MIQGLKDRKYDIAFCSMMDNEPLIEFTPVAKQELVLIVPKGHPLEGRSSIDLKDTLAYPQIAFSKRSGLRHVIDKLFKNAEVIRKLPTLWKKTRSCRSCRCRLRYRSCSKDAGSFLYACIHYRNRKAFLGKTLLYGYFKECLSGACYHGF